MEADSLRAAMADLRTAKAHIERLRSEKARDKERHETEMRRERRENTKRMLKALEEVEKLSEALDEEDEDEEKRPRSIFWFPTPEDRVRQYMANRPANARLAAKMDDEAGCYAKGILAVTSWDYIWFTFKLPVAALWNLSILIHFLVMITWKWGWIGCKYAFNLTKKFTRIGWNAAVWVKVWCSVPPITTTTNPSPSEAGNAAISLPYVEVVSTGNVPPEEGGGGSNP